MKKTRCSWVKDNKNIHNFLVGHWSQSRLHNNYIHLERSFSDMKMVGNVINRISLWVMRTRIKRMKYFVTKGATIWLHSSLSMPWQHLSKNMQNWQGLDDLILGKNCQLFAQIHPLYTPVHYLYAPIPFIYSNTKFKQIGKISSIYMPCHCDGCQ